MKYKKIELDIPPLGEILTCKSEAGAAFIGYFYLSNEKREFNSMFNFSTGIYGSKPDRWAKLPKFKPLKKERPPIGIEVLMCVVSKHWRQYAIATNIKDINIEDRVEVKNGIKGWVDSWIELEEFKEDKE